MKTSLPLFILLFFCSIAFCGSVEKTFFFKDYTIVNKGIYQSVSFEHTRLCGKPGEPELPYHEVFLMLPPGESAVSMEIRGEDETVIPGSLIIYPRQHVLPLSKESTGKFLLNKRIYKQNSQYPERLSTALTTQYLNGYAFALCVFTPAMYNPAKQHFSFYQKVTIKIQTAENPGSLQALKNFSNSEIVNERVRYVAQNPEMIGLYPQEVRQMIIMISSSSRHSLFKVNSSH